MDMYGATILLLIFEVNQGTIVLDLPFLSPYPTI